MMADMSSPLAPEPQFPERISTTYERTMAPDRAGGRGPLRFEEGLASDTNVPDDMIVGIRSGYQTAPGRPNHNAPVWIKTPEETMQERAHPGSASWPEAPTFLGEFSHGSFNDYAERKFEMSIRDGSRQERMNPAMITD